MLLVSGHFIGRTEKSLETFCQYNSSGVVRDLNWVPFEYGPSVATLSETVGSLILGWGFTSDPEFDRTHQKELLSPLSWRVAVQDPQAAKLWVRGFEFRSGHGSFSTVFWIVL